MDACGRARRPPYGPTGRGKASRLAASDRVDFDAGPSGHSGDLDRGSGRTVRAEAPRENHIYVGEFSEIGHEHGQVRTRVGRSDRPDSSMKTISRRSAAHIFLGAGHVLRFQARTASSLRSMARRSGF